tara:strand:+ start:29 stop:499 length:471 start_codon:yes stop_codon:yes gene_type:complete
MSQFKHTSWGRTRSPKNLTGTQGGEVTAETATSALAGITASTKGYATENQRYLHVLIEETATGGNEDADAIAIYGYCHAFQRWFELPESEAGGLGQNTANDLASIDPPNSSSTPANHVPAARAYRVYEIHGIDRVAFVGSAQSAVEVNIFAAASTF